MSTCKDKNILITGGAGGIGRLMGRMALEAGAGQLTVWDIDSRAMQHFNELMEERGHRVHCYRVNLSEPDEIYEAASLVLHEIGAVDILINNAGVVTGKLFQDHDRQEIEQSMAVNATAAMHTARAFIPPMIEQGSGHIVNIASASALLANPRMSVYAASKWALSGWSESLRLELEQEGHDIKVTTVQPGYIKTGMFAGVKAPLLTPLLEPEYIARKIIKAVQRNSPLLREPFMVKLTPFLKGILPAKVFDFIAGKIFGVYRSMETFTGRSASNSNRAYERD